MHSLFGLEEREIDLSVLAERRAVEALLQSYKLALATDVEYTLSLWKEETIVATASYNKNILQNIAVARDYQGLGLTNHLLSRLINKLFSMGRSHIFIFTKPVMANYFRELGFYTVAQVDSVALLENDSRPLQQFLSGLRKLDKPCGPIAAIIMNGNPFTLGHQHLIRTAAFNNALVHVFVVSEEASVFPFEIRYQLIKEGCNQFNNVIVHRGNEYIISNATFPSYFIGDKNDVVTTHSRLDLTIFGEHIAPALGIKKRYVGIEPYCPVTNQYNSVMKELLPLYGIEVEEIQRLMINNTAVSASIVRACLVEEDYEQVKQMVPQTTYELLLSDIGQSIIAAIKTRTCRH